MERKIFKVICYIFVIISQNKLAVFNLEACSRHKDLTLCFISNNVTNLGTSRNL